MYLEMRQILLRRILILSLNVQVIQVILDIYFGGYGGGGRV